MKMLIAIALVLSSLASVANGDPVNATSVITGVVIESGNADFLTGVRVTVKGTDLFTYTDRDGNFELPGVPAGNVELVFSLVSFDIFSTQIISPAGEKSELKVELISR